MNAKPPSASDGLLTWILGGDRKMRRSASKSRAASMPDLHAESSKNEYTNMLPDIYVIGLQELVKLDSKHAMSDKEGIHRQAEWEAWLLRVINSSALVNRAVEKRRTWCSSANLTFITDLLITLTHITYIIQNNYSYHLDNSEHLPIPLTRNKSTRIGVLNSRFALEHRYA